jgi:hypothetical protein
MATRIAGTRGPIWHAEERRVLTLLWREKFTSQSRRQQLTLRKVTWIIVLFAASTLKLPIDLKTQDFLYIVPFIAIIFDLYILGESFGIRRFARHMREEYSNWPDGKWETFMMGRRDPFSTSGLAYSTLVILVGAGLLLLERQGPSLTVSS